MQAKHYVSRGTLVEPSDAELLARFAAGDNTTFEVLIQRYQPSLFRFVSAYVGTEEAQDILQHVWTQLYLSLP